MTDAVLAAAGGACSAKVVIVAQDMTYIDKRSRPRGDALASAQSTVAEPEIFQVARNQPRPCLAAAPRPGYRSRIEPLAIAAEPS